jgi:hypothetical protein
MPGHIIAAMLARDATHRRITEPRRETRLRRIARKAQ